MVGLTVTVRHSQFLLTIAGIYFQDDRMIQIFEKYPERYLQDEQSEHAANDANGGGW